MKGDLRAYVNIIESKMSLSKLDMIIRLKLTDGPLYVVTLLNIIKQAKLLFVNELKLGREIRIPNSLTIKYLKNG